MCVWFKQQYFDIIKNERTHCNQIEIYSNTKLKKKTNYDIKNKLNVRGNLVLFDDVQKPCIYRRML